MKLDKIKFAKLVAMITSEYKFMHNDFVQALDDFLDIYVPEPDQVYLKNENVERLMALMAEGTKKIEAIREHRTITGMGLKDSKEAVERYWPDSAEKYSAADLRSKLNLKVWDVTSYSAIEKFIAELE